MSDPADRHGTAFFRRLTPRRLPDAVFVCIQRPSPSGRELIATGNRLAALSAGDAEGNGERVTILRAKLHGRRRSPAPSLPVGVSSTIRLHCGCAARLRCYCRCRCGVLLTDADSDKTAVIEATSAHLQHAARLQPASLVAITTFAPAIKASAMNIVAYRPLTHARWRCLPIATGRQRLNIVAAVLSRCLTRRGQAQPSPIPADEAGRLRCAAIPVH